MGYKHDNQYDKVYEVESVIMKFTGPLQNFELYKIRLKRSKGYI